MNIIQRKQTCYTQEVNLLYQAIHFVFNNFKYTLYNVSYSTVVPQQKYSLQGRTKYGYFNYFHERTFDHTQRISSTLTHNRCTFKYPSWAHLCDPSLDCTANLQLLQQQPEVHIKVFIRIRLYPTFCWVFTQLYFFVN